MSWALDPHRCADSLRERTNLRQVPSRRLLTDLCRTLGATVGRQTSGARRGTTAAVPDGMPGAWHVAIDEDMAPHRLRFTLAHEIGHLYLRREGAKLRREEQWCNMFAAELLMPLAAVRREFVDAPVSLNTVDRLVSTYGVSRSAALLRLRYAVGWEHGLIGLRLANDRWQLARSTALPTLAAYDLVPAVAASDLPRGAQARSSWLRFSYHAELIEILSQWQRRGSWTDVLVNVPDLERTCIAIMKERAER